MYLSADSETPDYGPVGIRVALTEWTEVAMLKSIPVDSRLYATRLRGSYRVSSSRSGGNHLLVVLEYVLIEIKLIFNQGHVVSKVARLLKYDKVTRHCYFSTRNERSSRSISSNKAHLGGLFCFDSCLSENGERLLILCSGHRLFLAITNFRHSYRWNGT